MAALDRWQLDFDDSGGDALIETPAGVFARLAAEAAARGLEPPTLLALLKHPLCRLGRAESAFRSVIASLELALLRGTRPQAAGPCERAARAADRAISVSPKRIGGRPMLAQGPSRTRPNGSGGGDLAAADSLTIAETGNG